MRLSLTPSGSQRIPHQVNIQHSTFNIKKVNIQHSTFNIKKVNIQHSTFNIQTMKANTWKTILQIAISVLTAIATTLGVTSCTL